MNINRILILIDKSFSMIKYKNEVLYSFEKFIKENDEKYREKKIPVTVILFNDNIKTYKYNSISDVVLFDENTYSPYGNTFLFDMLYKILNVYSHENNNLCLIITDGYNNNNNNITTKKKICNKLDRLSEANKWIFKFYGSLPNNFKNNNNVYKDLTHKFK